MSRKRWACGTLACIGLLILLGLLPCYPTVREITSMSQSANNLKQIGLALRNYHEVYGRLPPAVVCDKDGRALYSWRVLMLPFIELNQLYEQFHLDEPWDSPHNLPLSRETPRCYRSSLGGSGDEVGLTPYQVLIGPGTAFERPGLTFDDFPDGLENTIFVVAAADPVPWAKPVDLAYHPDEPLPRFNDQYSKPVKLVCYNIAWHKGFPACFGDGRYHFIRASTDEQFIRAIITRNGGEPVNVSRLD